MKQNVNVLLIVCDQFRGDALSFANHPDVKTPYLDSLAADGVFFSHAYSARTGRPDDGKKSKAAWTRRLS